MNKDKVRKADKLKEYYEGDGLCRKCGLPLMPPSCAKCDFKEPMSEEEIKSAIQNVCAGSLISCKNPQKLTLDEIKNAFKMFEEKLAQALKGKV